MNETPIITSAPFQSRVERKRSSGGVAGCWRPVARAASGRMG